VDGQIPAAAILGEKCSGLDPTRSMSPLNIIQKNKGLPSSIERLSCDVSKSQNEVT